MAIYNYLLKCNGGHINITKSWAISILQRMRFNIISDFEEKKAQFVFDIKAIKKYHLVINLDHTGINYMYQFLIGQWLKRSVGDKRNCSFCWNQWNNQQHIQWTIEQASSMKQVELIRAFNKLDCSMSSRIPPSDHITNKLFLISTHLLWENWREKVLLICALIILNPIFSQQPSVVPLKC